MKRRTRDDDLSSHLPLKPVFFLILLVLVDGERHGYGIVKEIAERSGGAIRLEPGNLYRFIRRLMETGMVSESAKRRTLESADERRRYYQITEFGTQVFAAEAARMKSLVSEAEARVPLPGTDGAA